MMVSCAEVIRDRPLRALVKDIAKSAEGQKFEPKFYRNSVTQALEMGPATCYALRGQDLVFLLS